jgi:alpha-1,3-rhamnosyltransferase
MNTPLVSVVVVTYNSSATVIETLESVKYQTFKNIELIVSDDCSKDNTTSIVERWMKDNGECFVNCLLINTPCNTGTAGNLNRGCKAAKGEWIKSIAADDRLLPQAIERYVNFIKNNPDSDFVFSKVRGIGDQDAMKNCIWLESDKFFLRLNKYEQMILLCCWNYIPAATFFIKSNLLQNIGGFDESIPLIEDWPFLLKIVHEGYRFRYMPIITAEYRFSSQSISQPGHSFSKRYLNDYRKSKALANYYMGLHGLGGKMYVWVKEKSEEGGLSKLISCMNYVNPFFWYVKYILYKVR